MKFIIDRSKFVEALNLVTRIVNAKNSNAILNNLKFEAINNQLIITGSNGSVSIITLVPHTLEDGKSIVSVEEEGKILVNARIAEIVRKMRDDQIKIEIVDGTTLKLSDSKSSFRLNTVNVKEYPDFDFEYNENNGLLLNKEVFTNAVNQTAFCASTKDSKPILKCINLKIFDKTLCLTATDAARLSIKRIPVSYSKDVNINVSAKTLIDVTRMLEAAENIKLYFEANKIVFKFDNTILISSLMSGSFPQTDSILKNNFPWTLQINSNEFSEALSRVTTLFIDNDVAGRLKISEEIVELTSKSPNLGSTKESIELFRYDGEPFEIGFNPNFLLEALKAANNQDIILKFNGGTKPFLVQIKDDDSLVQVITPVRFYD